MNGEPADTRSNLVSWTEEKIQRLKELWPTHSARLIGLEFNMTRSAIIGKAHRMGLAKREGAKNESAPRQRRAYTARPKKPLLVPLKALLGGRVMVEEVPPPIPVNEGVGLSIMELENHHCREVVGRGPDQLARYCGHPKIEHLLIMGTQVFRSAYCAGHALVNYRSS